MTLQIKPLTIIALLVFAAWLIGQPPRKPRLGVTPAPDDAPEPGWIVPDQGYPEGWVKQWDYVQQVRERQAREG